MPSSRPIALGYLCSKILEHAPNSVLDIGIGFGKFGFLAREYTDVWRGRYRREDWSVRIDGIEVFPRYITEVHRAVYTNIYEGDALEVLLGLGQYDLGLCVEVLEHMEKQRGLELLEEVRAHCAVSFFTLPALPSKQDAIYGNPYEVHRSTWKASELMEFGDLAIVARSLYVLEMKGGGGRG